MNPEGDLAVGKMGLACMGASQDGAPFVGKAKRKPSLKGNQCPDAELRQVGDLAMVIAGSWNSFPGANNDYLTLLSRLNIQIIRRLIGNAASLRSVCLSAATSITKRHIKPLVTK